MFSDQSSTAELKSHVMKSKCVYVLVLVRVFSAVGFGSAASRYRFCYLGSGSTSRHQGFGTGFSGGYSHLSNFGTSLFPFRFQFGSKWMLKLWYWNLNSLELKLLKFFGTNLQMLRFFRYFRF